MRGRCLRAGVVALAVLSLGSTPAAADKEADARLDEIRRAIEESRERLLRFDRNEFGLIDALEATDESISLLSKQVARTRKAKREADEELAAVVVEERELAKQMGRTQRAMSGRAVALYKTGDIGPLSLLFWAVLPFRTPNATGLLVQSVHRLAAAHTLPARGP